MTDQNAMNTSEWTHENEGALNMSPFDDIDERRSQNSFEFGDDAEDGMLIVIRLQLYINYICIDGHDFDEIFGDEESRIRGSNNGDSNGGLSDDDLNCNMNEDHQSVSVESFNELDLDQNEDFDEESLDNLNGYDESSIALL